MGWISPTGYVPGDWQYEEYAYDENLSQGSYYVPYVQGWTPFLILTLAELLSNKVRLYLWLPAAREIDIDVLSGGTWIDVFDGVLGPFSPQWVEFPFAECNVTQARIRYYAYSGDVCQVFEVDFWQVEAPPVGYQYGDGLVCVQT